MEDWSRENNQTKALKEKKRDKIFFTKNEIQEG